MSARPFVRARAAAYVQDRVQDLDRALVQALNRARALDYQLPRRRAHELSLALSGDLYRVRLQAGELETELDLVDDRARELFRQLARWRDFAPIDHATYRGEVPRARALAVELDRHRRPGRGCGCPDGRGDRVAAGLVAQAVRALPAANRARWREEFDGELWELAAAEASWPQQVRPGQR